MAALLVTGILALVLLVLGTAFAAIGLVVDEAFAGFGVAALAVGAVFAVAFSALLRRRRAAEARRTARGSVEVVRAELKPYVRIGVYLTYELTVRMPGVAEPVTRQVQVVPGKELVREGRIEVEYDPADPANFDVVR